MGRHFVCSDVHLGMPACREGYFYNFLTLPQRGDTLILLGDILDYWISAADIRFEQAVASWMDLYDHLVPLKERGVDIHYIPGNHDSFVFYTESHDAKDFVWSQWVFKLCETFHKLYDVTWGRRLGSLCTIHYPFYKTELNGIRYLFTHGHWMELTWKILAGDPHYAPEGRMPKFWVVAKALNTCFVYKHASLLRKVFNISHNPIASAFQVTRVVEDISYCVLAEVLRRQPWDGPWGIDPKQMPTYDDVEKLGREISDDFIAAADAIRLQDDPAQKDPPKLTKTMQACMDRGRQVLAKWLEDSPPVEQLDQLKKVLQRQDNAYNYTLKRIGDSVTVEYKNLSGFADCDVLVFGHFHKPRFGKTAVDEGCMLEDPLGTTVVTYLVIEENGKMNASWSDS